MSDEYDDFTEVPTVLLKQAIACLSYDATEGYKHNATSYADIRHGTGRALSEFTEMGWTDYPEVSHNVPEELFD